LQDPVDHSPPRMLVVWLVFMLAAPLAACTVLVLQRGGNVYVAKNLDWPVGEGVIVINRRGQEKTALLTGPGQPLAWDSHYGSVTFNMFGPGFPLGGMNEKGLVIEEANYSPSRYPQGPGPVVNEFQWIQYHLDTCADVGQVLTSLKRIMIVPILARVHYLICDDAGRVAVVEFIAGKARVYTGDDLVVPVMTNTNYANSLKSLSIHQGFGGIRNVGGGPESPERFVRAATWVRGLQTLPVDATPERAFHILDVVAQQDTQWRIIYDPVYMKIRFRTLSDPETRTIHMQAVDFNGPGAVGDIHAVPPRFQPITSAANAELLQRVFDRMVRLKVVAPKEAAFLLESFIAHARGERP